LERTLPWPDEKVPAVIIDGVNKLSREEYSDRFGPFLSFFMEKSRAADAECHPVYTERVEVITPRLAHNF